MQLMEHNNEAALLESEAGETKQPPVRDQQSQELAQQTLAAASSKEGLKADWDLWRRPNLLASTRGFVAKHFFVARNVGLHPLVEPVEYCVIPKNIVGGFEDPVVLLFEKQKLGWDVLRLEHLKHGEALALRDAIVVCTVYDEHRRFEICRVHSGRLGNQRLRVLPGCALEFL